MLLQLLQKYLIRKWFLFTVEYFATIRWSMLLRSIPNTLPWAVTSLESTYFAWELTFNLNISDWKILGSWWWGKKLWSARDSQGYSAQIIPPPPPFKAQNDVPPPNNCSFFTSSSATIPFPPSQIHLCQLYCFFLFLCRQLFLVVSLNLFYLGLQSKQQQKFKMYSAGFLRELT